MDYRFNFIVILFVFNLEQRLILAVDDPCTWPTEFVSSQWHDSSRGIITFSTETMQGWTFTPTAGTDVSSWDCLSVSTYNTDGRMILITSDFFRIFSTNYYAYLCVTVIKVTESSYRYYMNHEMHSNLNNERLFIYSVDTLTDQGTICSNSGASDGEYQMLIKEGTESAAKVNCPWHLLGRYGYTHTTSNGATTCDKDSSEIDTCTDTQQIKFDYSACSTKVAYSASDTVWCVDNIADGDTNYVMVFNGNDSESLIDNQSIYRFTCMAVSSDVSSASVSPKYCQNGQTPNQLPTTASGQTTGALLSFASATETCPTCPTLPDPDQGSVSISTMGTVTSALYICADNYTLWGTPSRTCQSDMTWTGSAPSCSCETPPTPSNGAVSVNSIGTVATYTCDVGFSLDGLASRICQTSSAIWEGNEPNCTECQAFSTVTGQTSILSTSGTDTSASFSCASGYTLSGYSSLSCSAVGTWDAQQPDCVICATLNNPSSGTVTLSSNGSTSTATYACSSGYTLQGDTIRTCQLDGTWDNSQPSCLCNQPSSPSNGAVVANGETATYTCNVGFSLSGDATRTCQADGTGWGNADPQCSQCNALSSVTGGSYTTSTTGTVTSAKYSCEVGYSLDGVTTITCQSDGSWSSSSPSCIICPNLTNPSSGTVTLSTSGTKSSATYTCASGYTLNGNTVRLCNSDGTWSLMEPTCTCESPGDPPNGQVTDDGTDATYTCDQGYSLSGLSTRSCNTDGTGWSGSDPTCNVCETLSTPTGGTVVMSTDGINTVTAYTCNNGYTLNGVSPITCRSDGSWDFTAPTCSRCPDLSDPDSGTLSMTTTGTVTTATFTCQSGYYLSGAFTLTCISDGFWSGDSPTCKCNFPVQPSNGEVSVSGTQLATYSCDTGYSLNGMSMRTCQTDGTGWDGSDPLCTVCQLVTNPTSGTLSLSSNGTHTGVIYACNVGTTLNGVSEQVCTADGSWDASPPTCASCPTPVSPGSGSVLLSISSSSTIATYSCVTGYTLNSTSVLTCTAVGTWDLPYPYCVCLSPPTIANGDISVSDDLRTATYTCNVGYVLVGSGTRTCQDDGTGWDGTNPVCDESEAEIPTDESKWRIPIAAMVIIILVLIILAVLLGAFVHLYCRLRQERSSREASAVSREPEDPEVVEERYPVFTEPKPTGEKSSIVKKYQNSESRPTTASTVIFANGVTAKATPEKKPPSGKVQLPPIGHILTEKRKTKRLGQITPEKKQTKRIRTQSRREPRAKTPIKERMKEIGIDRVMTPELLSTVDFSYIQPIYPHELDTDTGRDTVLSRKGERLRTNTKNKKEKDIDTDKKK